MAASVFDDVEMAPAIEVFKITAQYNEDTFPQKVNLGVGAYRTEEGKPFVLPEVHGAEQQMVNSNLNHEYLPVTGLKDFREAAQKLILGDKSAAIAEKRVDSFQCLGGTGCIRLAAEFLKRHMNCDTVYVSKPTWGNHKTIFKHAYFSNICEYRYWDPATRGLNIDGMIEDLRNAPEKAVVILHAVAHNPTGVDPTEDQWGKIADVCQERNLFVIMDNAYQGFATGDLDNDAFSSRLFESRGFEFFIAQSFSKNFGLYNERIGNLCVVARSSKVMSQITSQMSILVRTMWSNPPNHGARVVATVLCNPTNYSNWKDCVKKMAGRIQAMRKLLLDKLREKGTPGDWSHITKQIGMFCYTGLTPEQVTILINEYHIYLLKEGRINMCGITPSNVDYVVKAIDAVVVAQVQK